MRHTVTPQFLPIPELTDTLLSVFPHRFDYIWADHPRLWEAPQWHTESRHSLSDRLIKQGSYLYGVRFGAETRYCLLDIDAGSLYHPKRDPLAVRRMMAALEQIGLVSHVAVTSSYSGGVHLYLPFSNLVPTWQLAAAVEVVLQNAGFTIEPGQLEILPNTKRYEESPTLYKAHRLPLQAGSYLLSDEWHLAHTSQEEFVRRWHFCMAKNDVQAEQLEAIARQLRRKSYRLSNRGTKFLNDLNAEIEAGWTAHGQTNHILGRIAMRCYIFGHLLDGGEVAEGDRLTTAIMQTAVALPGYRDWCRHQHEIWHRCEEWARAVERCPRYFPYGKGQAATGHPTSEPPTEPVLAWNEWQMLNARGKIARVIGELLERGILPAAAKGRFEALTQAGIGGGTLYRHRDLWHPDYLWNSPPEPPDRSEYSSCEESLGVSSQEDGKNLLPKTGSNPTQGEASSDCIPPKKQRTGSNHRQRKASSHFDDDLAGHGKDPTRIQLRIPGVISDG